MARTRSIRHLKRILLLGIALAPLLLASCTTTSGTLGFQPTGKVYKGKASWYSIRTNRGRRTASGEPLSNAAQTAAHKHLPMGTWVRVTNLQNGRSEVVRITDRGPYIRGRIIDVTIGVAERLDFVNDGVVPVQVEIMQPIGRPMGGSA